MSARYMCTIQYVPRLKIDEGLLAKFRCVEFIVHAGSWKKLPSGILTLGKEPEKDHQLSETMTSLMIRLEERT